MGWAELCLCQIGRIMHEEHVNPLCNRGGGREERRPHPLPSKPCGDLEGPGACGFTGRQNSFTATSTSIRPVRGLMRCGASPFGILPMLRALVIYRSKVD